MNSWTEMIPLGDLGKIVSGSTPRTDKKEYWGGDIPWITPADLTKHEGIFFRGELRKITKAGYESCSTTLLPAGSILFSSRAPIGHCAVTTYPLCSNQGFKSLVPNESLDSVYGFFALKHFTPQIISRGRGATFVEINKEIFTSFRIPIPPLTEQKRIAAILSKADRLRRLHRYARKLSDTFLQSVFLEMFGDPILNPKGWEVVRIGDVVSSSQYGTSQRSNIEMIGYPIIGMGNITENGKLDLSSLAYVDLSPTEFGKLKLEKGDVIFNRTNSTELVGKTTLWSIDIDAVLASYLVKIRLTDEILPTYFVGMLNTSSYKQLFQLRCRKAVGQSNISPTLLKEFDIPLPPPANQEAYHDSVSAFEEIDGYHLEATRQGDQLFQSLLHRAFRGEL
jgi:type I restriction enzyme S subunit